MQVQVFQSRSCFDSFEFIARQTRLEQSTPDSPVYTLAMLWDQSHEQWYHPWVSRNEKYDKELLHDHAVNSYHQYEISNLQKDGPISYQGVGLHNPFNEFQNPEVRSGAPLHNMQEEWPHPMPLLVLGNSVWQQHQLSSEMWDPASVQSYQLHPTASLNVTSCSSHPQFPRQDYTLFDDTAPAFGFYNSPPYLAVPPQHPDHSRAPGLFPDYVPSSSSSATTDMRSLHAFLPTYDNLLRLATPSSGLLDQNTISSATGLPDASAFESQLFSPDWSSITSFPEKTTSEARKSRPKRTRRRFTEQEKVDLRHKRNVGVCKPCRLAKRRVRDSP